MPNTKPPADSARTVRYILKRAEKLGSCGVLPVACITKGMRGGELTDFAALGAAGAVAFSDDGMPVEDDEVILAAMARAKELEVLLMLHEENLRDRGRGVANEGENARKAKLHGIPAALEDSMTARDIFYAQKTGARVHICHVSTVGSVELVRRAKASGVAVTCETAPHYFSLTDEEILGKDPNTKVNPPLRGEADRQAVIGGIADGTIDAIATDHAPHTESEKKRSFARAPFGRIGFETAFSLAVTYLYRPGVIKLEDIARLMSVAPRAIVRRAGGEVRRGMPADIVLTDIGASFVYTKEEIVSKAKNSPFIGKRLYGRVMLTIAGGKVTYDRQADRQDH
jgi:dihydroorotase